MSFMIEVVCPHCGAHGQVILPPVGTIIVGPCPECLELVVVFCGQVLALDKQTMTQGSVEEKREHLLHVLTDFLRVRLEQMITVEAEADATQPDSATATATQPEVVHFTPPSPPLNKKAPISKSEIDAFASIDLKLLDRRDYFRAVFG